MPAWLQDGVATVVRCVPRLALFLVILVIGWLIATLLRKGTDALLERVGFDRAAERGGVGRAMRGSQYDASDIAALLVYYAVLLFTLQLAFGVFGPNPVSVLITAIIGFLPKLFIALVIVVVGSAIAGAVADLIRGAMGGRSDAPALGALAGGGRTGRHAGARADQGRRGRRSGDGPRRPLAALHRWPAARYRRPAARRRRPAARWRASAAPVASPSGPATPGEVSPVDAHPGTAGVPGGTPNGQAPRS
jgi:Conserved TM helix